jgi:hypothetical protein
MTECKCNTLSQWATDLTVPIEFDAVLNEYHMVCGDKIFMLYYCPLCGGRLPESRRGELFVEASPEEQSQLESRLAGVKTIDEIIARLGEPDLDFGATSFKAEDKAIYGYKDVIRSIRYERLAKTLTVSAQELEDGALQIFYTGKVKEAEKESGGERRV